MTRYMLDTNIISDLIRKPQGNAAKRIAKVGEDNICTSIIVAAELRYGCAPGTAGVDVTSCSIASPKGASSKSAESCTAGWTCGVTYTSGA